MKDDTDKNETDELTQVKLMKSAEKYRPGNNIHQLCLKDQLKKKIKEKFKSGLF